MKNLFKKISVAIIMFSPVLVFAQDSLSVVAINIARLINFAIPLAIAIGLLVFLWGVYKYAFATEEDKKEYVHIIVVGIGILFVMVSVWGLVYLYETLFGFSVSSGGVILPSKQINIFQLISK